MSDIDGIKERSSFSLQLTSELKDRGIEEDICLGAICDVKAKLLNSPDVFGVCLGPCGEQSNHHYYEMYLVHWETFLIVQSDKQAELAVLNSQFTQCSHATQETANIRRVAFIDCAEWKERVKTRKETEKPGILTVHIVLYSHRRDSSFLGTNFSKETLSFQHPIRFRSGTTYENPHYLAFPNAASIPERTQREGTLNKYTTSQSQDSISAVLESLREHRVVNKSKLDQRICTPLYDLQRGGVDYVLLGESGINSSDSSLWQHIPNESGRSLSLDGDVGSVPNSTLLALLATRWG
ncbi:hypothetical protein K469DRAFT_746980 [Zopfia rhizophila CBS 207.26]|uniref:Uncharacterized protein n=1 Tax=Zopfia rhizophila CBS 207.26 TaxID=1314779 RepID=A0A6A6EKS6_9PEZI|nr:hypothetical protein K469DRAFT_746980 [Zopfia rhizophila CBS 207.26]